MAGKWDRCWWPQGTTNGSWQKCTNSGPGSAYPVVEAHAQNTIKESEQKMLHQSGWLTIISLDQGTYLQTIMSNNGQWDIVPWVLVLWRIRMSNENTGYLKWEEIKQEGLACTHLHERVLTLNMNMSRTQECLYWRDFSVFPVNLGKRRWGRCWYTFSPISPQLFFPYLISGLRTRATTTRGGNKDDS